MLLKQCSLVAYLPDFCICFQGSIFGSPFTPTCYQQQSDHYKISSSGEISSFLYNMLSILKIMHWIKNIQSGKQKRVKNNFYITAVKQLHSTQLQSTLTECNIEIILYTFLFK